MTPAGKENKSHGRRHDADQDLSEFLLIEQVLQQPEHFSPFAVAWVLNVALGGGLITDIPLERPGSLITDAKRRRIGSPRPLPSSPVP